MKQSLSIVIPNFNGLGLLQRHLASVVKHSKHAQIIVIDDASTDQSVSWLKKNFPQIKVIANKKNLGFSRSVNKGFKKAKGELVLLLNNDVTIHSNTIDQLIPHFSDPKVFAVGCLEKLPNGQLRGKSLAQFKRGMFVHSRAPNLKAGPTAWVFGASGMFNKKIWLQLKGLDDLYRPAYYEDIDISYRATKAGFKCLFEPKAIVKHDSEQSMNSVLGRKKPIYVFKNQILFFWKNITDPILIFQHVLWMPYHLTVTTLKSNGQFLLGLIKAVAQVAEVSDQQTTLDVKLTDRQIIDQYN